MANAVPQQGSQFDGVDHHDQKKTEIEITNDESHERSDFMSTLHDMIRHIGEMIYSSDVHQKREIKLFYKHLHLIQQSQSGTGKIATFCSEILVKLNFSLVEGQALVLAPTLGLAKQIKKVMRALGDYLGAEILALMPSVMDNQKSLRSGVHVVVGTPGRVFETLLRNSLKLDYVTMYVFDEADEIFVSRNFKDRVH